MEYKKAKNAFIKHNKGIKSIEKLENTSLNKFMKTKYTASSIYSTIHNSVTTTRSAPPMIKQWTNGVYNFNNNFNKNLPSADIIAHRLIKNFFTSKPLAYNPNGKPSRLLVRRLFRLSLNTILVSKPEVKHFSNKINLTVFLYNKKKNSLIKNLKKNINSLMLFPLAFKGMSKLNTSKNIKDNDLHSPILNNKNKNLKRKSLSIKSFGSKTQLQTIKNNKNFSKPYGLLKGKYFSIRKQKLLIKINNLNCILKERYDILKLKKIKNNIKTSAITLKTKSIKKTKKLSSKTRSTNSSLAIKKQTQYNNKFYTTYRKNTLRLLINNANYTYYKFLLNIRNKDYNFNLNTISNLNIDHDIKNLNKKPIPSFKLKVLPSEIAKNSNTYVKYYYDLFSNIQNIIRVQELKKEINLPLKNNILLISNIMLLNTYKVIQKTFNNIPLNLKKTYKNKPFSVLKIKKELENKEKLNTFINNGSDKISNKIVNNVHTNQGFIYINIKSIYKQDFLLKKFMNNKTYLFKPKYNLLNLLSVDSYVLKRKKIDLLKNIIKKITFIKSLIKKLKILQPIIKSNQALLNSSKSIIIKLRKPESITINSKQISPVSLNFKPQIIIIKFKEPKSIIKILEMKTLEHWLDKLEHDLHSKLLNSSYTINKYSKTKFSKKSILRLKKYFNYKNEIHKENRNLIVKKENTNKKKLISNKLNYSSVIKSNINIKFNNIKTMHKNKKIHIKINKINRFIEKYFKNLFLNDNMDIMSKNYLFNNLSIHMYSDMSLKLKFLNQIKNLYLYKYIKDILTKEILYIHYTKLLCYNNSLYKSWFLTPLKNILGKVYNKQVIFNFINLKYIYLNSDLLTQGIVLKLRNLKKNRLNRVLRKVLNLVLISKLNTYTLDTFSPTYRFIENHYNKFKNLNSIIFNTWESESTIKRNKINFNYSDIHTPKGIKIKWLNHLQSNTLNLIKYKSVFGLKLETAGRLTKRSTASRALFKFKYKGNLKNNKDMTKDRNPRLIKSNLISNIQYSKLGSKTRNGSFGIKTWINNN